MKFKIKQNILMEHLNYVIKGISSKNLIPILNCIKFELTNDGLYLMSTDNEISIKTFIMFYHRRTLFLLFASTNSILFQFIYSKKLF